MWRVETTTMKAILNHIAIKKVAKHVNRTTATSLGEFLLSEGYVKTGRLLTKDRHQFVFNGHGDRWVVSHRKVDDFTRPLRDNNDDLATIPHDDPRHTEILEMLGLTEVVS